MPAEEHPRPGATDAIEAAAAAWLARRDRGFTADDETEFALWRFSDPRHAAAVARIEAAWGAIDALRDFRPGARAHPDPDLLADPSHAKVALFPKLAATAILAAAAALAVVFWWPPISTEAPLPLRQAIVHPGPERLTLDDGSVVELNHGARVDVRFTAAERRVTLLRGEALFMIAKNSERPFIVGAGEVAVRAVGTVFSVTLGQTNVAVLVTEGRVRLGQAPARRDSATISPLALPELIAGQRAVITTALGADGPQPVAVQVDEITPAEVDRALAWQRMRLEFVELPLGDVVAEFNRFNRQKLVVEDARTAAVLVGGNFRADNIDAFVRLLDSSFGVTSSRRGEEIVLRKTR